MRGVRLALAIGIPASGNLLLGLLLHWYVAIELGAGSETDAVFASYVVSTMLLAIFCEPLAAVLTPFLAEQRHDFSLMVWNVVQVAFGFFVVLAVVAGSLAPLWIPAAVPGFDGPAQELTLSLAIIQLLTMPFAAIGLIGIAACNALHRFVRAELALLIANAFSLGFLFLGLSWIGPHAFAWAMLVKWILLSVLLIGSLGKYHQPQIRAAGMSELWQRLRPLLVGTSYYKTDQFLDRLLASLASPGGLTLLHLGQQLYGAGNVILAKTVTGPVVPTLASRAAAGDWQTCQRLVQQRFYVLATITGAGFLFVLTLAKPMLEMLLETRGMSAQDIHGFWALLLALSGIWFGGVFGQLFASSFYAFGNTGSPTRVGIIGFSAGIVFKIGGFLLFGVIGIALGTTCYYLLNAILMQLLLKRYFRERLNSTSVAND